MKYNADSNRYSEMLYRTCGDSGVKLPLISLGLWHNFGGKVPLSNIKKILFMLLIARLLLILIWQIIMAHLTVVQKVIFEEK